MKIAELNINDTCTITLVVKSATARETRAKKPYLALEFFDGVDTINGNYWDWTSGNIPAPNSIVDVRAQVTEWMGRKQLNIKGLTLNTSTHLAAFAPASTRDLSEVFKDVYALASSINNPVLCDVTLDLFERDTDLWLTVPGAKSIHHAYTGGTLVHSLSVARIAAAIADTIPEANKDLCIAAALLHDIGKLYTYQMQGIDIQYTLEGHLLDHIVLGSDIIKEYTTGMYDPDDYDARRTIMLLRHIILAHHGSRDFGSPVVPMCIEAHIVHMADMLDARAEQIRAADAKATPQSGPWTDRLYGIGTAQLKPSWSDSFLNR